MSLVKTLGFVSPKRFIESENLGWHALPFDDPATTENYEGQHNLVFGLVQREDIPSTPSDVFGHKWTCKVVDIDVDNVSRYPWDGQSLFSAMWHRAYDSIPMEVCALEPEDNAMGDHFRFAQMLGHASSLLKKFKKVIVQNVVLRKKFETNHLGEQMIRWYNLRESLHGGEPKYITSDCEFAPRNKANSFLGCLFECFTHWTYEYHGRQALVCGFRGVNGVITDVNIMDNTQLWFLQNTYTGGLQLFSSTHVCGAMCDSIGLIRPPHYYPVGLPPVNPQG
ncbi:uncharacterized protein MELLADRAFT_67987 [Melampsora larici-populina 98AG31]|uniref:Alpha-type protein kinase domain-containing protein n=1 Tax=Melampsora larici-populina (strain 98AG31 / pathotype 3-4-7) TaxID=747676 RepID=F4S566_MELLP|nr:uncharacterized protein MELLADRAFT_67987 [Melampsora larici-populina 98AG31]EGG00215.1 hypothetical protein MELLADRAFT_67987 [Melampsora larici-populina 98AG31]